jgi:hypothetical protein
VVHLEGAYLYQKVNAKAYFFSHSCLLFSSLLMHLSYLHGLACSAEKYHRSLLIVAIGNDKARKVYEKIGYRDIYERDYVKLEAVETELKEMATKEDKTSGKANGEREVEVTAQVLSDACMSVMLTPGFDILLLDL